MEKCTCWVNRVRGVLIEQLPEGCPPQGAIANILFTSTRSLRRRLQHEGTTYIQVLQETRRDLGVNYTERSLLPITEIALLLGFAETSSFSRAYRRWTGMTPSLHRRRSSSNNKNEGTA